MALTAVVGPLLFAKRIRVVGKRGSYGRGILTRMLYLCAAVCAI